VPDPGRIVTTAEEAELAVLLGVAPPGAAAAVAAIAAAGLLEHGIAVIAAVAASRWGLLPADAIAELAAGRALHGAVSDYELRMGRSEAEDEVGAALRAAEVQAARSPVTQGHDWAAHGLPEATTPASAHHLAADDLR
jgi:hypothetical protein